MEALRGALDEFKRMKKRNFLAQGINLGLIVTSALMIWKALILFLNTESPIVVVLSGSMEPGFYRGDILFLRSPRGPIDIGDIVVFNTGGNEIPIVHRVVKLHEGREGDVPSWVAEGAAAARGGGGSEEGGDPAGSDPRSPEPRRLVDYAERAAGPANHRIARTGTAEVGSLTGGGVGHRGAGPVGLSTYFSSSTSKGGLPSSSDPASPHPHVALLTKGDNNWGDDRELYPRGWEWLGREHVVGRVFAYVPHIGRLTILLNDYPLIKVGLIAVLAVFVLTSKE